MGKTPKQIKVLCIGSTDSFTQGEVKLSAEWLAAVSGWAKNNHHSLVKPGPQHCDRSLNLFHNDVASKVWRSVKKLLLFFSLFFPKNVTAVFTKQSISMRRPGCVTSAVSLCTTLLKKQKDRQLQKKKKKTDSKCTLLCFPCKRLLTPEVLVQLVPEHVKEGYDWHVEKEEGHQTRRAEESKKWIHPNSDGQVHPHDPIEPREEKKKKSRRVWWIIVRRLVWRKELMFNCRIRAGEILT